MLYPAGSASSAIASRPVMARGTRIPSSRRRKVSRRHLRGRRSSTDVTPGLDTRVGSRYIEGCLERAIFPCFPSVIHIPNIVLLSDASDFLAAALKLSRAYGASHAWSNDDLDDELVAAGHQGCRRPRRSLFLESFHRGFAGARDGGAVCAWGTPCPRTGQASEIQQIPIFQSGRVMRGAYPAEVPVASSMFPTWYRGMPGSQIAAQIDRRAVEQSPCVSPNPNAALLGTTDTRATAAPNPAIAVAEIRPRSMVHRSSSRSHRCNELGRTARYRSHTPRPPNRR